MVFRSGCTACALFCALVRPCDGFSFPTIRPHVPSRTILALSESAADSFSSTRPHGPSRSTLILSEAADSDEPVSESYIELVAYWKEHGSKWTRPLRLLDVQAAWTCGELDGLLPSGKPSRVATSERMLSLGRAVELFEKDELQVRRRFRNLTPVELAPRWDRAMATRTRLQAAGTWDEIVSESDKSRAYQRAMVRGDVEDADASPLASRVVATVLSPALKAAAKQRARADGGVALALAELLETAGDAPAERWLTAVLLAEFEGEIDALPPASMPGAPSFAGAASFAEVEAQRDVEQANTFGLVGVGAALLLGVSLVVAAGGAGGGDADGLQRTLDLMQ